MLVGREAETAGLATLLEAARLAASGALVLRGEAGIGKTALLAEAEAAADGFLILRATGIESEAELPYATLHQLLRPLEDRVERLPEPQARALSGLSGLGHGRQIDRFLVGVGTLTLLADAAESRPVLALLDDAAWFDRASLDALSFTARRLHAEAVVLLFAARDEPGRPFSLPGVRELGATGTPLGDMLSARARALLAAPEDADERFRECLAAHEGTPWRFLRARTELAYGELLRRARRRTEARVQLRSALERFEALEAAPWADRAASELRATGETARKRDPSTLAELTPQELQIARLAAEGDRNREIAGRLFLSPKTVEYHLRKVFQKLDIASRSELARLLPGDAARAELTLVAD